MRPTRWLPMVIIALSLGLSACGGSPAVPEGQATSGQAGTSTPSGEDTGELKPCPEGEVRSAPGNKCRTADDSEDGE